MELQDQIKELERRLVRRHPAADICETLESRWFKKQIKYRGNDTLQLYSYVFRIAALRANQHKTPKNQNAVDVTIKALGMEAAKTYIDLQGPHVTPVAAKILNAYFTASRQRKAVFDHAPEVMAILETLAQQDERSIGASIRNGFSQFGWKEEWQPVVRDYSDFAGNAPDPIAGRLLGAALNIAETTLKGLDGLLTGPKANAYTWPSRRFDGLSPADYVREHVREDVSQLIATHAPHHLGYITRAAIMLAGLQNPSRPGAANTAQGTSPSPNL